MNMQKLSNSNLLGVITKLITLLVIVKSISLGVWWFLPSEGVELHVEDNYNPPYQRVDFKNMIERTTVVKPKIIKTSLSAININNMILKGLYGTNSRGYAIISLKSKPKKTSIISIGEKFSNYKLKSILKNSVIFTKFTKEYILEMQKIKKEKLSNNFISPAFDTPKIISKMDIKTYAKNPNSIWRDISIKEIQKGKRITGFRVTNIRKNSKMAKLGLLKGDIIIRANNIKLNSYQAVMNIYNNINKLTTVQIVVLRNNKEKELVYEIN